MSVITDTDMLHIEDGLVGLMMNVWIHALCLAKNDKTETKVT